MKGEYTTKYWTKWASLSGKQKGLFYNPGNILKRKAILNYVFHDVRFIKTTRIRILDVGGGLGDIAFEFFQKVMQSDFFVLDIDRNALREAKTTLQYFTCEFIQADAQKLPFKSETFDIVICSEVLEHLPDDSIALREIERVLCKDGSIITTIPLYESELSEGHLRNYDLDSFLKLCGDAHLEVKNISFRCRSIHVVKRMLRKLYKRKGMGEKESVLYSSVPLISKTLVSILTPIDNALANRHRFSGFLKVFNEATLVACLAKAMNNETINQNK